ncbi:MAG: JAB domain-containing protein [Ruminococcus sp.]|nr:JAB domain-containing protein [Ruminococcus sp.]
MNEKEILENFISIFDKKEDAKRVTDELFGLYGNLNSIFDSNHVFFMKNIEMREQTAVLINIISAINRRCEIEQAETKYLNSADIAKRYFQARLTGYSKELLIAAVLGRDFEIIKEEIITNDAVNNVSAAFRKFAETAFSCEGAKYMIVTHNHPSGNSRLSDSDVVSTVNLINAMKMINITVADHIVVGGRNSVSMHQEYGKKMFESIKGYSLK